MKISMVGEAEKRVNYIKSATGPKLIAAGEVNLDEEGSGEVYVPYFGSWTLSYENGEEKAVPESTIAVTATENSIKPSGYISVQIETIYNNGNLNYRIKFQGNNKTKLFYSAMSCGSIVQGTRSMNEV